MSDATRDDIIVQTRHEGTFIDVKRMREASVLVGGAGALGNEVVKNLVLLGVGRICLVDFDHIEAHNLARSVFFAFGDRKSALDGEPKVDFMARMIRRINTAVKVETYCGDIADLGSEYYREFDVAFSCFDDILPRYVMNERCARAGIPLVDGGLGASYFTSCSGSVRAIDAEHDDCYACRLRPEWRAQAEQMLRGTQPSCAEFAEAAAGLGSVPTTVMTASIIGAAQVIEGVKFLSGEGIFAPNPHMRLRLDLGDSRRPQAYLLASDQPEDCPFHWAIEDDELHSVDASSDEVTLHDLFEAAEDQMDRSIAIELPYPLHKTVECMTCNQEHPWISVRHQMLGIQSRERKPDRPIPEAFRLPCGCEDGVANASDTPVKKYFGSDPPVEKTLRELFFPWMAAYGVFDTKKQETTAFLTLTRDRAVVREHS
jgi:adenylyltransferase/sulfurtransferase